MIPPRLVGVYRVPGSSRFPDGPVSKAEIAWSDVHAVDDVGRVWVLVMRVLWEPPREAHHPRARGRLRLVPLRWDLEGPAAPTFTEAPE